MIKLTSRHFISSSDANPDELTTEIQKLIDLEIQHGVHFSERQADIWDEDDNKNPVLVVSFTPLGKIKHHETYYEYLKRTLKHKVRPLPIVLRRRYPQPE